MVSEWGSFVDEEPSGGRESAASSARQADDEWGTFAAEPAREAPAPPAADPGGGSDWGTFAADGAAAPAPGARVPVPSSEVVASLLTAGETLWAQVDGAVAVLGSGCTVTAEYDGEPDGFSGWRPVTVVDPARLIVRPVPLALAEPPAGAAVSVAELYADPEPPDAGEPHRARPFPVGEGPDVEAMLHRAVEEERGRARAEAAAAARRAEEELAAARRALAQQAEATEQRALDRERRAQEEARRARESAEQQVAAARAEAQRQVTVARDEVAQAMQHWQLRAQHAEADRARLAEELERANRTAAQRLVLVGALVVIMIAVVFVLKGA